MTNYLDGHLLDLWCQLLRPSWIAPINGINDRWYSNDFTISGGLRALSYASHSLLTGIQSCCLLSLLPLCCCPLEVRKDHGAARSQPQVGDEWCWIL